jgi:DNA-binding MarR family transcriptional regulator
MSGSPAQPTTGYLLWRLTLKWRAAADRALAPFGLTHAQYALLASLHGLSRSGRQPSQRELADYSSLEPMYVSKLARGLERAGLLQRADNPADPRAFQLTLTEQGLGVVGQAVDAIRQLNEDLTRPIGGSQSAQTRELIDTLNTLLGGMP